jgi:hypothetical protein
MKVAFVKDHTDPAVHPCEIKNVKFQLAANIVIPLNFYCNSSITGSKTETQRK